MQYVAILTLTVEPRNLIHTYLTAIPIVDKALIVVWVTTQTMDF